MDFGSPGSSVHGFSQARIPEWVPMPSSRGSSQPRDGTHVSCLVRRVLYLWATWEAPVLNIPRAFLIWSPPHRPASHFPLREGDAQSLEHLRSSWDSSTWSSSLMGDWQTPKELSIHSAGPTPWSFYLSACPRYWPRNTWNPTHVPSSRWTLSPRGPPVPAVDLGKKLPLTSLDTQPDGSVCPEDKKPSQSAFCSHWVWVLSLVCYSHSSQVACHSSSL